MTQILTRCGGWTAPREITFTVPIGLWGKRRTKRYEMGGQMLTNMLDGLNSFGAALLGQTGVDRDYAERLVTAAVNQYKDSTWRMSMNM